MRIIPVILSALAFAAAGVGAYFAAGLTVSWIENSSATAVEKRLAMEGFDWASVQTDGLKVVLEGEAASEALRFKALAAAGQIVEAARVIDNFTITDSRPPVAPKFSVEILRNDKSISLIGLVPTKADNTNFKDRVARLAGDLPVADFLETADYPVPDAWSSVISYGLLALERLEHSKISIGETQVTIVAIGESEAQKSKLLEELTRRTPADITSKIGISAPRPVITPFTLRFRITADGATFDACSADSPEAAAQILAAAKKAGLAEEATCRQGLGVPSPLWSKAATQAIAAVTKLGGGSVTLSDADVTLTAPAGTDPALFDTITSRLDGDLPEVFALNPILLVAPENPEDDAAIPEMVATLSPEGQVQIRGPVISPRAQRTLQTFAYAVFGSEDVYLSTKLQDNLPEGWMVRSLASLAGLSKLNSGIATVSPNAIDITGLTGRRSAKTDIAQILIDRLGDGAEFELEVTYLEELDPLARMLNGAECVVEITDLASQNKIKFEPGSATLDDDSRDTVQAIAEVFERCLEAPIEIGGHTDSQGREEMNLNLSKGRAEAVLTALRGARVKLKSLTAEGYGETQPIADNSTEEGREANRRIEFRLMTPATLEAPSTQSETSDTATAEETSNE
ncbi:Peptidoglycan-associated lipoprotein [Rhodobacteraceae bacterium IMCC1933]|nr:Peptidoglycan-associated lipoprotein [Rhodobacteraceae bacterium IMCC1923]MDP4068403.1 Peptidoglycan-associated lipoprotein [Rhodobacteraceae bacterium IMCC1933]MDP4071672.1 Peptidoglycan-associated lipoprotein [Rhodobacteraceae bacterium IMCC1909]